MRAVGLPTAIALIALAAMVAAILDYSTSQTDEIALSRQNQRVRVAVEQSVEAIRIDQEASTYWDDAVIRTRQVPLDLEWIDDNLGVWFNTYYHIDEVYLLDARDRPIYAMQNGNRVPLGAFAKVSGPALKLAGELRSRLARHQQAPAGGVERTIGASEMAMIGGRPALVSLKPILSQSGKIAQPRGSEYFHVAVRYLDGSFLAGLTDTYAIERPRFSSLSNSRASLAIRGPDGRALGFISWRPFEPGRQVEDRMIPVLIVALLIVGALTGLLLLRIRRSRMELEASRTRAQHLAFHDSLTGLPNRALFENRLDLALSRRDAKVTVLLLDLDRFKNVNDTLGHQAGDALIRELGQNLRALARKSDTISRLGGDEFALLIEDLSLADAEALAARIIEDVCRPFEISGAQVHVGTSIGIAAATGPGTAPLDLVRKADIALYHAKDGGRNTYRVFSPEMDEIICKRRRTEDELRDCVTTGQGLVLHYQPQVSRDGAIIGFEALLRWEHAERGLVTPNEFIPVAEETGLIVPLGEWVLREACLASARWGELFVALNLSPVQFRAPGFVDRLIEIVRQTGADPRAIQLEVTERVLLDDDDSVGPILARLRGEGFKVVLDDFGTGYSSLSYLRRFQVDKIKIDSSFVSDLCEEPDCATIVTAVLALGWAMGLTVAAEGVETAEQCTFLEAAGCQEMQGHYFAPALPEGEIAALLADRRFSSAA